MRSRDALDEGSLLSRLSMGSFEQSSAGGVTRDIETEYIPLPAHPSFAPQFSARPYFVPQGYLYESENLDSALELALNMAINPSNVHFESDRPGWPTGVSVGLSEWLSNLTRHPAIVNSQVVPELAELESAPPATDLATIGAMRDRLALIARDYERRDREARLEQLHEAASRLARREPTDLLNALAVDRGLSWHTLSTMLNVTPSAIRKWRRGGSLTPENREQLVALVAFFDLLEDIKEPIADLGSWVEMRVREDTTLTPAVMYAGGPGQRWLLLEWARGYLDTAAMLDRFDESWRETYARDPNFFVGEGPGGERAIISR
ncbi:MAG: hypothetical protein ACRDK7_11195 [Solirubrobacteraceae bacterium]